APITVRTSRKSGFSNAAAASRQRSDNRGIRTMKIRTLAVAGAAVIALAAPVAAYAHFILQTPKSWIVENQLGDPQKAGPCGGTSANKGEPTGAVTEVM